MPKRIMVQCSTEVDKNAVRREIRHGVEHVIISSFTMPNNVVMNGIIYPANEIANSFGSLERTLAPIEHPTTADGKFLPSNDPVAINQFYAGAHNENVRQVDGRIAIDKVINVPQALLTERGKRLMDRIEEIETNSDPRPIHTSTGIFLEVEETDGPQNEFNGVATNAEFTLIAHNMTFDHDAILLDSVGAAKPSQGVGMAVNAEGDEVEVHFQHLPGSPVVDERNPNIKRGMSFDELREKLESALAAGKAPTDTSFIFIADIYPFDNVVVFENDQELFEAQYLVDGQNVSIASMPLPVTREIAYTPKTNRKGDAMKDRIIAALNEAKIPTEGLDDDALFAAYNELTAAPVESEEPEANAAVEGDAITNAVAAGLKPLATQLDALQIQLNQSGVDEVKKLAAIVANSGKFGPLKAEDAALLPLVTLKEMAASCPASHGVVGDYSANTAEGGVGRETYPMVNSAKEV